MGDSAVRHPTRVLAQSGRQLLTFAMHQHVLLFRQLTNTLAALAKEKRGHVRIRLAHIAAAMQEELADLEQAVMWAATATAPKSGAVHSATSLETTKDEGGSR